MDYESRRKKVTKFSPHMEYLIPMSEGANKYWAQSQRTNIESAMTGQEPSTLANIKGSLWNFASDLTDPASVETNPDAMRDMALREATEIARSLPSINAQRARQGLQPLSLDQALKGSSWNQLSTKGRLP